MSGHIQKKGDHWYCVIERGRDANNRRLPPRWVSVRKELGLNKPAGIMQARELLISLLAEKQKGTFIKPNEIKVGEYLDYWLSTYGAARSLSQNTLLQYEQAIRLHLKPALGDVKLQKLTPLQIQNYLNGKPLSRATVIVHHNILNTAFKKAVEWELLARSPMDRVLRPQPSKPGQGYWNEEETNKFLSAIKEHPRYPLFLLSLTTGMRAGEILPLTWEDVNLKENVIHIRNSKTPAGIRSIDISPRVSEVLSGLERNGGLVFPSRFGNVISTPNAGRILEGLIIKAGVRRITFHGLRHTHASIMLARGMELKEVAERLGHSNTITLQKTYAHVLPRKRKEAATKMDDLY